MTQHDVIVIGGGPGGYVAAIRAAQLGLNSACVDERATLGGTCLNVGCIPSKTLLHNSHLFAEAGELGARGIRTGPLELDLAAMMADKDGAVDALTAGINQLFRKYGVVRYEGRGQLAGAGRVVVEGKDSGELAANHVVIATGSVPSPLAGVDVDENRIVTSTGALSFAEVPDTLVVVGAGYIGLELGSVWRRLGSKVTVVEFLDRIVPAMDQEVARRFHRSLAGQGITFQLGSRITAAQASGDGVALQVEPTAGGEARTLRADRVLVATGRSPRTEGLGLASAGVEVDSLGRIQVDEQFRTSAAGIYAIGDVTTGPMLAHKASQEGHALADLLAGHTAIVNYGAIPSVVYTDPEVAWVGATEEQLKELGTAYRKGRFPFTANARGRTTGQTEGMVKILSHASTDRILGVHVIGASAGELIGEATVAIELGASAEDLALTCHAHPTLSESVREAAAAAAFGSALHA